MLVHACRVPRLTGRRRRRRRQRRHRFVRRTPHAEAAAEACHRTSSCSCSSSSCSLARRASTVGPRAPRLSRSNRNYVAERQTTLSMAQLSSELAAPISTTPKASRPSTTRRARKPQPLPPPVYTRAKLILTPHWQRHKHQPRCPHDEGRHNNDSSEEDISDEKYLRRHRRERLRLWRQASVAIARQKRGTTAAVPEDASKEDFSRDEDEVEDEGVSNNSECQYNYDISKPWKRPDQLIRIVKGPCKWKEPVVEKSKTEFVDFQKRNKKRNKSRSRPETPDLLNEFPSFLNRSIQINLPKPDQEHLRQCRRLQLSLYHLNLLRHLSLRRQRGTGQDVSAQSSTGGGGVAVESDTGAGTCALRDTNSIRMKALRKLKTCIRRYKGKQQLLREMATSTPPEEPIPNKVDARVSVAAAAAAAAAANTLAQ